MGGPGSGNRWRYSGPTCEGNKRIDLKFLKMKGWLVPGNRYYLTWNMNGEPKGNTSYTAHQTHLYLDFRLREHGEEEWTPITQTIRFDYTPVHFGGQRKWLVCPRCQRRCRILYGGSRFYCRKCHGLKYRSQSEDSAQRAITRAQATRKRLGGSEGIDDPFPPRPKGMHWKTYRRLEEVDEAAAQKWDLSFLTVWSKFGRR